MPNNLMPALALLLLTRLPAGPLAAALYEQNDTDSKSSTILDFSRGVSLDYAFHYESASGTTKKSSSTSKTASAPASSSSARSERPKRRTLSREQGRGRARADGPPAEDSDPEGVRIFNSLDEVPTSRLLLRAHQLQKCYPLSAPASACWTAYVCGHRCEPVLLAVNSFCRRRARAPQIPCSDEQRRDSGGGGGGGGGSACEAEQPLAQTQPQERQGGAAADEGRPESADWVHCKKARKYQRCYARVCFRRRSSEVAMGGRRPVSYEDPLSVSIVRYRRPPPKHEVEARKKRQSSTQSAIFK